MSDVLLSPEDSPENEKGTGPPMLPPLVFQVFQVQDGVVCQPLSLTPESIATFSIEDPPIEEPLREVRAAATLPDGERFLQTFSGSKFDCEPVRRRKLAMLRSCDRFVSSYKDTQEEERRIWRTKQLQAVGERHIPVKGRPLFAFCNLPFVVMLLAALVLIGIGIASEIQNAITMGSLSELFEGQGWVAKASLAVPYMGLFLLASFVLRLVFGPLGRRRTPYVVLVFAMIAGPVAAYMATAKLGGSVDPSPFSSGGPPMEWVLLSAVIAGVGMALLGKILLTHAWTTLFDYVIEPSRDYAFYKRNADIAQLNCEQAEALRKWLNEFIVAIECDRTNYISLCMLLLAELKEGYRHDYGTASRQIHSPPIAQLASDVEPSNGRFMQLNGVRIRKNTTLPQATNGKGRSS